jgi:rifampicin phosphotransferase
VSVSELDTLSWGDRGDVHRDVPFLVDLRDPIARDPAVTGGKAAALATAAAAGLATLPGVVLTTVFSRAVDTRAKATEMATVRDAFVHAGGDAQALVVRSSSVIEDTAESSMAGQFASVIGVRGFDEFVSAVHAVLDSRARAGAADLPIGVLIQPLLEPVLGGVLFGVDPVTGRTDRRVVSAVFGGPEPLVSGVVTGSRYVLDPRGRTVDAAVADGPSLARRELRRLAALSTEVGRLF